MQEWERLAQHASGQSVFGQNLPNAQILAWNKLALSQEGRSVLGSKAKISGSNLFTRLNYWIVACGGQPVVNPPELAGIENPSSATIVCQGDTFTFKLDQALSDNGGIFLVIEASEGQSNGVTRAHSKAVAIKMVEEPDATAVDIRADYVQARRSQRCGPEDLLPLLLRQLRHRREVRYHAGGGQVGSRCSR